MQKKAGMLMARFGPDSAIGKRLEEVMGAQSLTDLWEPLAARAEELRFRFDNEVGEQGEDAIAQEILGDIEKTLARERFKMKFV